MEVFIINKREGIFSSRYRALTIGIILAVMAVAFEGLSVTTIAPVIAKSLRGMELYGWIFSAYLLAQILGTMIVGQQIDRSGPAFPFIFALFIFSIGLIIAAVTQSMLVLIIARALQGFGAGAILTCVYTSISLSYPDELRTKILAVFSSAYVLPALIGPYVAGIIAQYSSWRFVFWVIIPFIILAAFLSLPSFKGLKVKGVQNEGRRQTNLWAIQLTIGTGLLLSGLGMMPKFFGVILGIVGLILMIIPLRRFLPSGTFVACSGLPAMLASRGLFMACYTGTQSFLVLALTEVKGYASDTAGLIVASAALSWSTAAYIQARLDERDKGQGRRMRVLIGVFMMCVGIGVIVWVPIIGITLAVASQIIIGFGIGLAHPTSGAISFAQATEGTEGEVSASLQFVDSFTPGIVVGIGGALITISHTVGIAPYLGISAALGIQLILILISLLAAYQLPHIKK
ncbi:MFS transporter [Aneurinibacillus migulanus]|nr:MFS transporter [Aneurinibacillus migulanus]